MTVFVPGLSDKDPRKFVLALQQLSQGRSNAVGTVTLVANAGSTTVTDQNCAAGSNIQLTPLTADAAAALTSIYFSTANGSFVINHANIAQTDRRYTYAIIG